MTAHRVAAAFVAAVLLASSQIVGAQAGWPRVAPAETVESKPKAEVAAKPVAVKTVAAADAPKAAPPLPKAPVVEVKKPAVVPVKAEAAPVVTPDPGVLQSLTVLLARQTTAIEALLRRLDASESKMSSAPAAAVSADDPAYAAPMPPVVVPVAAVSIAAPAPSKPMADAGAPAAQIAPRPVAPRPPVPSAFSRWGDLQQFNLSMRYRFIENSAGVRTNDQVQNRTEFRGRFKFDRAGHYALNTGVFTGAASISGWNNTGWGTGDPARNLNLKQLYFAAVPIGGLELQYGGIYVNRGEGTQITTYDNDLYLTGQRVGVKRPKQLWFDEISATQAYLGDAKLPSVWDRFHRLGESNYYQLLVGKKVGKRVGMSADYTSAEGVSTWRSAVAVKAPELTVLDGMRVETYARPEAGLDAVRLGADARQEGWPHGDVGRLRQHRRALRRPQRRRLRPRQPLVREGERRPLPDARRHRVLHLRARRGLTPIVNQERFDLIFTYDVLKTFAPAPRR